MDQPEPIVGYWWLPGNPDVRCYGRLQRLANRWQLVLGGELADATEGRQSVYGVTEADTAVTLLSASAHVYDEGQMTLDGAAYLEGVHLSSHDEPIGAMYVAVPEAVHLLDHQPDLSYSDTTTAVVSPRRASGPVELSDGTWLEVVYSSRASQDLSTRAVTVRPEVTFRFTLSEPTTITQARDNYAFPVRDFVALGTQAHVSAMKLQFRLPGDSDSPPFSLKTVRRERTDEVATAEPWDRLLKFSPDDDVAGALGRWFTMHADYRLTVTLLLAQLLAAEMYTELRLTTTFMALESFQDTKFGRAIPAADRDPRYAQVLDHLRDVPELRAFAGERLGGGEKGLKRRIEEVVEHAGGIGILVEEALPGFQKRLRAARGQNVAHPGRWNPDAGRELVFLNRGLWWILTACILRQLGYSETEAILIVRQCSRFSTDMALFHHLGPDGKFTIPPLL